MVLMCFFIYNFSFFAPNIIKKEIGYKKKAIKTHNKSIHSFPPSTPIAVFVKHIIYL